MMVDIPADKPAQEEYYIAQKRLWALYPTVSLRQMPVWDIKNSPRRISASSTLPQAADCNFEEWIA